MTLPTPTRLIVLSLGLWVALVPAIVAAPAAMAAPMIMSDDVTADGCIACPDVPLGNMDRGLCSLMCSGTMLSALPSETVELTDTYQRVRWLSSDQFFSERPTSPDPAPPKSVLP